MKRAEPRTLEALDTLFGPELTKDHTLTLVDLDEDGELDSFLVLSTAEGHARGLGNPGH